MSIYGLLYNRGNKDKAKKIINKAIEVAEKEDASMHKSQMLSSVSETLYNMGNRDKAEEIIDKAIKVAEEMKYDWDLLFISEVLCNVGNKAKAEQIIKEISSIKQKDNAYKNLSYQYFIDGNYTKSKEMFSNIKTQDERIELSEDILTYVIGNHKIDEYFNNPESKAIIEKAISNIKYNEDSMNEIINKLIEHYFPQDKPSQNRIIKLFRKDVEEG